MIWSGSGGLYAPRAIGLEVLRRGGDVIRFDHGTPKGFVRAVEANNLVEFAVSSEFLVATEAAAGGRSPRWPRPVGCPIGNYSWGRRGSHLRQPTVAAGEPPTTRKATRCLRSNAAARISRTASRAAARYCVSQLAIGRCRGAKGHGHTTRLPAASRGPVSGAAPSVGGSCPHDRGQFEAQLSNVDVFVFDYPSTTALWEAVCPDAHIVFLDIGAGTMTRTVAKLFNKRARVLEVAYDEANRPILDIPALRDAVLDEHSIDPTPFRRLLAGEI